MLSPMKYDQACTVIKKRTPQFIKNILLLHYKKTLSLRISWVLDKWWKYEWFIRRTGQWQVDKTCMGRLRGSGSGWPHSHRYCLLVFTSITSPGLQAMVPTQLTHTIAERFLKVPTRLGQFIPSGNVLGKVFHNVSVIYMFNIIPHKTLHNLKYTKLKMVCTVVLREQSTQMSREC